MGSTTSLDINILNIHDSEVVTRDNSSLIQPESVLLLGNGLVHEILVDPYSFENYFVGLVFDLPLLLFGYRGIMSDVQMCIVDRLFSSVLPNVWP